MSRKIKVLLTIFVFLISLNSGFTQSENNTINKDTTEKVEVKDNENETATTDENVVPDDAESPTEPKIEKEEVVATNALKPASYFDGISTFVNSKVKFELVSKDNVATDKIFYKIDNANELQYNSPFSIMDEGKHLITYYAVDKVGNKEDTKNFKVVVDNTPPEIKVIPSSPVIRSGDKLFASDKYSFVIEASDNLSGVKTVEYSFGNDDFQTYVAPFSILNEGNVTLQIKAMDNVTNFTNQYTLIVVDENGNTSNLNTGNLTIFIDKKPPMIEITPDKELIKKDSKYIATQDYTYTISASDAEAGLKQILFRIDGKGEFKPYSEPIKFKSNGNHIIEAKAIDKVGNESAVERLSVFVDIVAPETNIKTLE